MTSIIIAFAAAWFACAFIEMRLDWLYWKRKYPYATFSVKWDSDLTWWPIYVGGPFFLVAGIWWRYRRVRRGY